MISIEDIEKTIMELEQRDTTFATCEKLADLYIVLDHIKPSKIIADSVVASSGADSSEFIMACDNVPVQHVLSVLDEHMESVRMLYPREYRAILNKIKGAV